MSRKPQAFTVLELVVALALSAMLLVAISNVTRSIRALELRSTGSPIESQTLALNRLLWSDLAQSREVWAMPECVFFNYEGRPPRRGPQSLKAGGVLICYRIVPGGPNRLVRQMLSFETITDVQNDGTARLIDEQTVAFGATGFTVQRVDEGGRTHPLPQRAGPCPAAIAYRLDSKSTDSNSNDEMIQTFNVIRVR